MSKAENLRYELREDLNLYSDGDHVSYSSILGCLKALSGGRSAETEFLATFFEMIDNPGPLLEIYLYPFYCIILRPLLGELVWENLSEEEKEEWRTVFIFFKSISGEAFSRISGDFQKDLKVAYGRRISLLDTFVGNAFAESASYLVQIRAIALLLNVNVLLLQIRNQDYKTVKDRKFTFESVKYFRTLPTTFLPAYGDNSDWKCMIFIHIVPDDPKFDPDFFVPLKNVRGEYIHTDSVALEDYIVQESGKNVYQMVPGRVNSQGDFEMRTLLSTIPQEKISRSITDFKEFRRDIQKELNAKRMISEEDQLWLKHGEQYLKVLIRALNFSQE